MRKRNVVTSNFPGREEFIQAVHACYQKAKMIAGCENLPVPHVGFFPKGKTAAWCKTGRGSFSLEFNVEAIAKEWDDMVKDTIPHEMGHMVEFYLYGQSDHGARWKSITLRLGGSGSRTHRYNLQAAKRTRKWLYVASCGTETWVGTAVHNRIQQGMVYSMKTTGGKLLPMGFQNKQKVKA